MKKIKLQLLLGIVVSTGAIAAMTSNTFAGTIMPFNTVSSNTYNILKNGCKETFVNSYVNDMPYISSFLTFGDNEDLHFGGPVTDPSDKPEDCEITITSILSDNTYNDGYTQIPEYIKMTEGSVDYLFDNYITRIKNADTLENDILSLPSSIKEASFNEIRNKYIICNNKKMSVFSAHYIDQDRFVNVVSDSDSDVYKFCRYQDIPVSDGTSPQLNRTDMTLTVGSSAYIQMLNTTNKDISFNTSDSKIALTPYSDSRLAKGVYVQALRPGKATVTCNYLGKEMSCVITILPADKKSVIKSLENFYDLNSLTSDQKNALAQKLYFDCVYQDHPDYDVYPYMTYINGVNKSVIKNISSSVYQKINKKKNASSLAKKIDEFRKYSAPYGESVDYAMNDYQQKNKHLYTQKKGLGCIKLSQNTDLFNDPRSTEYLKPQF